MNISTEGSAVTKRGYNFVSGSNWVSLTPDQHYKKNYQKSFACDGAFLVNVL